MTFQSIGARLKYLREDVLGLTQEVFANRIEASAPLVHSMETGKRNVTKRTITSICTAFGVSRQWIETGEGDILQKRVADPKNEYDLHGGWKPRSIEDLTGVPEAFGMGRAVEMLARIYHSKNQDIISAIYANLRVFCERIDQEDKIANLKNDVTELRQLMKNHAKTHAYYGVDRRSGLERRQLEGSSPTGIERRSGEDRRKENTNIKT